MVKLIDPLLHIQNTFANKKHNSHPTSSPSFPLLHTPHHTALPLHFPSRNYVSKVPLSEGQTGPTWEAESRKLSSLS